MTTRQLLTDPEQLCRALEIPFSDQQLEAITAPIEPGVIIAGAGSGKTTVMAARVVWLVGTGQVRPEDVLGLTFTRKAAAELAHRVRTALLKAGVIDPDGIDDAGEQVVMTYDAFAGRLVAEHGVRLGVDSDPVIVTGATRYRLAEQVVSKAAGPFEQLSRLTPGTVVERVLSLDGALTSHLVTTEQLREDSIAWIRELDAVPLRQGKVKNAVAEARARAMERLELAGLVDQYQELKQRLGFVEFSDQLVIAARLAEEVPAVSAAVREQWPVVLLDEYQDTSSAQAALLQALFSGETIEEGRGHAVTAVGDPCQAIYGWRGAAASNISRFARDFPRADGSGARGYELSVNRRSGQRILDVANELAKPLHEDPYIIQKITDLVAPEGTPPGEVHAATFQTQPEENAWIAEQVVAAHPSNGGDLVTCWSDIAVLCRRNDDIGPVYSELSDRDVPVEIVGLGGLLKLPEIADVVGTLRLLDDVTANPAVTRLLSGPRWAIGARDLALLGKRAQDLAMARRSEVERDSIDDRLDETVAEVDPTDLVALLDAVGDPGPLPYSPQARDRFKQFHDELTELRSHCDEPLPDLLRRVVDALGLGIELAVANLSEPNRADHLAAFADAAGTYLSLERDGSLTGFLAWLDAELEHGTGLDQAVPSNRDSVKLLTIHKAKGLEWELVFLPSLVDGTFPSTRVTNDFARSSAVLPPTLRGDADSIPQVIDADKKDLDAYHEDLKDQALRAEHRLAYVAVTRARQRVVATGHYWRDVRDKVCELSRYLEPLMDAAREQGHLYPVAEAPEPNSPNPMDADLRPHPWPVPVDPEWGARRAAAAELVRAAHDRLAGGGPVDDPDADPLKLDEEEIVAAWDSDIELLLREASDQHEPRVVPMPAAVSASRLIAAQRDPERMARQLVRPMPTAPSPAADLGTRFHGWVQRHLEMPALVDTEDLFADEDDLMEPASTGSAGEPDEFAELCRAFRQSPFADRQPYAIEQAVTFTIGTQVVRSRIDAVYREPDGSWLVVDWKTHHRENADPHQLALYRLAWAQVQGVDVDRVHAGFFYVRSNTLKLHEDDLPSRDELVSWVTDADATETHTSQ
ncbi:UvrD-helicase domain-containing protein [Enemella sp. A6]|uniref:UvrD-helicase domain-containing protein n=1 Tax=Enemella sp. A6 TaxID=3440152 RepID=UPI003EBB5E89